MSHFVDNRFRNNTGQILVLFILLVIISCTFFNGGIGGIGCGTC